MKKKRAIFIAGVIMASIIAVVVVASGSTKWWETDNQFGKWRQTIEIIYPDGTSTPLEFGGLFDMFSFYYQGREFVGLKYKLSAMATGSGYTQVLVNVSDYKVYFNLSAYTYTATFSNEPVKVVLVDGNSYLILETYISIDDIVPPGIPDGNYILAINPSGVVKYCPNSMYWYPAILPSAVTLDVVSSSTSGELSFILSHSADPEYTTIVLRPVTNAWQGFKQGGSITNCQKVTTNHGGDWPECIDDEPLHDGMSTYVSWNTEISSGDLAYYYWETYGLSSYPSGLGNIDKVIVYLVGTATGTTQTYLPTFTPTVHKTGSDPPQNTLSTMHIGAWESVSREWTANQWSGSQWTWTDISTLEIGAQFKANLYPQHPLAWTQCYAVIKYQVS